MVPAAPETESGCWVYSLPVHAVTPTERRRKVARREREISLRETNKKYMHRKQSAGKAVLRGAPIHCRGDPRVLSIGKGLACPQSPT